MKFLHEGIAMGKNKSGCECNTEREQTKREITLKANFSNIKKKIHVLLGRWSWKKHCINKSCCWAFNEWI
jgi:uracil-DNA glycosylase